jgi:molybdenum cofactor guanylyltransferase
MEPVTGVLLVGGASTRFGSPKALARFGARTLAELAWERLAWCDERLAFGKAADALPLAFPVQDDGFEVRAPLAGLVAGLRAAGHDLVVALPVDLPLITEDALRMLAAECVTVAVPPTGPLPGAYRRTTLPVLERRLAGGELKLRDALSELDARVVELDPAVLVNVNRPRDLGSDA